MAKDTMTSRERILAALRGEEVDRFPVWLKMANRTWQNPQPEPYRSMSEVDLHQAVGADLYLWNGFSATKTSPHVQETRTEEAGLKRTVFQTPDGELVAEESFEPHTQSWHPTRYPIQTPDDLRAARWLFRDAQYSLDPADVSAAAERQKQIEALEGVSLSVFDSSPLMEMVKDLAGPENAAFLGFDEPALFDEMLDLMHAARLEELRVRLETMDVDTLFLSEDTTTALISPAQFEKHCMPHLTDYGHRVLEAGIIPIHHMCGSLNALLEMIDTLPAMANEAFTTRPLGDVSLAEGRTRMPSKALIGGTNATLFLEPVETIVETVAADLADCPDRRKILLTSAGVLPADVSLEKACRIVEELKQLPL